MHLPDVILVGITLFFAAYILYPGKKLEKAMLGISLVSIYTMVLFVVVGINLLFFS